MALDVISPLAFLLVLGALVAMVVFVVLRVRAGEPLVLPLRTILLAYFHLMSIVAVLILASGLATLLKASLSEPFGRGFSYYQASPEELRQRLEFGPVGQARPTPEQLDEERQKEVRRIEQEFRGELIQGATLAIVGTALWPLHAWGRRRLARPGDTAAGYFAKTHLTLLLVLASLVGVISMPAAIHQSLSHLLLPEQNGGFRAPPGGSVGTALVFVPLWLAYLWAALRRMRSEGTGG